MAKNNLGINIARANFRKKVFINFNYQIRGIYLLILLY